MNKKKLLIDCDPGHDDAIALMLAFSNENFEVLGITVESGNQTLDKTSQNAINICSYFGKDIDVVKGVNHPLIKEVNICSEIHGESGLDGFEFPIYSKKTKDVNGIQYIIDTLLKNDKVTIVATGPLTNIALSLRCEPKIIDHIEEIVLMGGSIDNGNVSPASEFNILCDPEACDIIMKSNIKVKMIGLNVTRKVLVLPQIIERMRKINNNASVLFVKLMEVFNENQQKTFGLEAGPLHDPVTIVSLIDENVVKFQKMNVTIDLSHGESYGRTNCDVFDFLHKKKNCYVATDINVEKYWDIIEEGLSKLQ